MVRFSERRARFNRRVTNRLVRPVSGYLPMWSIVEHTGRRGGTTYRTPVSMFRTPVSMFRTKEGVAVLLPYGRQRDWVKNLQHTGGGTVKFEGRTFAVDHPESCPPARRCPR